MQHSGAGVDGSQSAEAAQPAAAFMSAENALLRAYERKKSAQALSARPSRQRCDSSYCFRSVISWAA